MEDFELKQQMQMCEIRLALFGCPSDDRSALAELAVEAAQVAHQQLFNFRFGSIQGDDKSVIFVNMGRNNRWILQGLRRELKRAGVPELTAGNWPQGGDNAGYTFAVIIATKEDEYWCDMARRIHVALE